MKYSLFIFLFNFYIGSLKAQDVLLTRYFDSAWSPVTADSAFYICDYKNYNTLYLCECFWQSSGKLKNISMKENLSAYSKSIGYEISYFEDQKVESSTLFDDKGFMINSYRYYQNGQLADSTFYDEKGEIDSGFHYFPSGKTRAIYFVDKAKKTESLSAFNENGEPVKSHPYFRKAFYGKTEKGWLIYLQQNLNPIVPIKKNAPPGEYKVMVKFTIDKDGSVSEIKAETNHGFGMEQEVIKLVKKSSKWNPEVFLGEPQKVVRRQPVTFVVPDF